MCLWKPQLGRPITGFTFREKLATLPGILPIFAVVLVIFGAIYTGKATPTEAAALGAMIVFAIYVFEAFRQKAVGEMGGRLKEALLETAKLTAMIFTLIWGVFLFVRFLGFAGLPASFAGWVTTCDLQDAEGRSLEVPLQDVFRGIGPFFVADVATVGVLLAFPGIVLWLPSLMG